MGKGDYHRGLKGEESITAVATTVVDQRGEAAVAYSSPMLQRSLTRIMEGERLRASKMSSAAAGRMELKQKSVFGGVV